MKREPRRPSPLCGFLLCAGKGTRFYPHAHILPKVLLPFLNLSISSYNLYLLKILGVKKWAVNIHVHPEMLKRKLKQQADTVEMGSPVFSYEQELLGSAGGLLKLASFFEKEKHFFYLNGDSFIFPEEESSLNYFYTSHVESGALASFLVRPTRKEEGVLWADRLGRICSFLKKPKEKSGVRPYDFSGLALFSGRVFREIKPGAHHIFKDVLELGVLKSHLRVHSVSSLKLLDMNQLSTYLQSTRKMLCFLRDTDKNTFLHKVLNCFSPQWNLFQGENYFSATKVTKPPESKQDILFCGREVRSLEKLSVKNFAILGDRASLVSDVCMEQSVLGADVSLKTNLQNKLILKNPQGR